MSAAVIVFPGSNCDRDLAVALERATGRKPHMVWHTEADLPAGVDAVAVPGGFSYGDYLRSGAIAARSARATALNCASTTWCGSRPASTRTCRAIAAWNASVSSTCRVSEPT